MQAFALAPCSTAEPERANSRNCETPSSAAAAEGTAATAAAAEGTAAAGREPTAAAVEAEEWAAAAMVAARRLVEDWPQPRQSATAEAWAAAAR